MQRIKREPLAARVAEELKQEITKGVWTDILPSEHKLSAEVGISRTTLRRALAILAQQNWLEIQQGSPTRIIKTSDTVGQSSRVPTKTIGILSPCPLSEMRHYTLIWIDAFRSILYSMGYGLHLEYGKVYYREHTGRALGDLVKSHPADCWILVFSSPYIQKWFQENHIPAIVSGNPAPGVELPYLATDNKAVMFHAVGQLTGRGHKNIALISEDSTSPGLMAFESSFLETCSKQAHRGIKGNIIKLRDTDATTAKNAIWMALKRETPPTAFVVISPFHCLTALTSLPRRGYRIPEDISVITTFGDPSLEYLNPVPAHYVVSFEQLAKKMADLALKVATGFEDIQKENFITPTPEKGQSIGSPPSVKV
jgi:DNA-binding LacI/PurR family transcriptional regulator